MPRLTPMNSAGLEARTDLTRQLASLDPSVLEELQYYWNRQPDSYSAWTNPTFSDLRNTLQGVFQGQGEGSSPYYQSIWGDEQGYGEGRYGGVGQNPTPDADWDFAFTSGNIPTGDEQQQLGNVFDLEGANSVMGAPGTSLDFIPFDFVQRHEAEFRAIDPSFNLETLEKQQHPVMGDVVLLMDLPQLDQTSGEMFGEMLRAAAGIAAGAAGISAFAGAYGMPGISSLFEFGASPTTGLDSILGLGGEIGGGAASYPVDLSGPELIGEFNPTTGQWLSPTGSALPEIGGSSPLNPTDYGYPSELPNTDPNTNMPTDTLNPTDYGYPSELPSNFLDSLPSWLRNILPSLGSDAVDALLSSWQNGSLRDDADEIMERLAQSNTFRDMAPYAKELMRDTSGLDFARSMMDREDEFVNPFLEQATTGFNTAANLIDNPGSHPGWGLAATAAGGLESLYTDPMSNPIMEAVSRLSAENASRRSAAGRGLNSGSYQAELQDALMSSLGQNFSNIANPMNQSVQAGSGFYTGDVNAATNLGQHASNANYQAGANLGNLINAGNNTYNAVSQRIGQVAPRVNDHVAALGNLYRDRYATQMGTNTVRNNTYGLSTTADRILSGIFNTGSNP